MKSGQLCKNLFLGLLCTFVAPTMVGCVQEGGDDADGRKNGSLTHEQDEQADGGWGSDGFEGDADLGDGHDCALPEDEVPFEECEAIYTLLDSTGDEQIVLDFPECFDGPIDEGFDPDEDYFSTCDVILEDLEVTPVEYHDAVFEAFDACLLAEEGYDDGYIPGEECEIILEALDYTHDPIEIEFILDDYDACLSVGEPGLGDHCEFILDELAYAPEELHETLWIEYEECVLIEGGEPTPGYDDAIEICDPILDDLQWAQTEEEADLVFEAHIACLESFDVPGEEDDFAACEFILDDLEHTQTQEEADLVIETFDACIIAVEEAYVECGVGEEGVDGDDDFALCEGILDDLELAQTVEEADLIIEAFDACIVAVSGPDAYDDVDGEGEVVDVWEEGTDEDSDDVVVVDEEIAG